MTNGGWRLSYIGSALVVSSGLVFYSDKKPKGLTLDMILEAIKEHPRTAYYEWRLKRRVTLSDALAMGKFADTGKMANMVSSIDLIRLEHDRAFYKVPMTGEQLLSKKYRSKANHVNQDELSQMW